MYSQCPDCLARFRITAAQLRAAHGTVRCGRCGGAFDALARLSDSLPVVEPADDAALLGEVHGAAPAASGVPAEYHFSAADLEKVFIEARDWAASPAPDWTATPAKAMEFRSIDVDSEPDSLEVEEPERIEDITLEGERIRIEDIEPEEFSATVLADEGTATPLDFDLSRDAAAEYDRVARLNLPGRPIESPATSPIMPPASVSPPQEHVVPPHTDDGAATPLPVETVSPAVTTGVDVEAAASGTPSATGRDWPFPPRMRTSAEQSTRSSGAHAARRWVDAEREESVELPSLSDDHTEPRRSLIWTTGCIVLALLLAAQLVHYFREPLLRGARFGPALRSVYERLGFPVTNAWDLDAFEIRQWGSAADDGASDGPLRIRASVTNRATFAQPFPLLRLEIEDRFGEDVAVRDFEPAQYLRNPAQGGRMLAAGESAAAELDVVAAGADAVGYRLNVCMRDVDATVRCASSSG